MSFGGLLLLMSNNSKFEINTPDSIKCISSSEDGRKIAFGDNSGNISLASNENSIIWEKNIDEGTYGIAIMKDGLIEQLDTPANIVLNPKTEYVRKFTQEVPREKVLKIESVMEPMSDSKNLSDLKVSKDAIIETVAEKILAQEKPVSVIDFDNKVVGVVKPSKVIHTVFGGKKEKS